MFMFLLARPGRGGSGTSGKSCFMSAESLCCTTRRHPVESVTGRRESDRSPGSQFNSRCTIIIYIFAFSRRYPESPFVLLPVVPIYLSRDLLVRAAIFVFAHVTLAFAKRDSSYPCPSSSLCDGFVFCNTQGRDMGRVNSRSSCKDISQTTNANVTRIPCTSVIPRSEIILALMTLSLVIYCD